MSKRYCLHSLTLILKILNIIYETGTGRYCVRKVRLKILSHREKKGCYIKVGGKYSYVFNWICKGELMYLECANKASVLFKGTNSLLFYDNPNMKPLLHCRYL